MSDQYKMAHVSGPYRRAYMAIKSRCASRVDGDMTPNLIAALGLAPCCARQGAIHFDGRQIARAAPSSAAA